MPPTRAIILAAGVGSRLRPLTADRPKCLLDVGGLTLLERQLQALDRCGIRDVIAVIGYRGDLIRRRFGGRVRYCENDRYEATNSLYSLWLAKEELAPGALILNSDVLAGRQLYERLVESPAPDAILVQPGDLFEPEDTKVTLRDSIVLDFGKDLPRERAHAHNVGIAKFGREGARRLTGVLDELVAAGHENEWVPSAFRAFASRWPLAAVATGGLPWIEIDFPADLTRARRDIEPAILALDGAAAAP